MRFPGACGDRVTGNGGRTTTFVLPRRAAVGLSLDQVWLDYFALGGEADPLAADAYFHGLTELPAAQRDILAHAVNERLDLLVGSRRAGYSREVRETRPRGAPLVALLEGTELAPPERLAAAVETAGAALGARITVYLADYEQHALHPLAHNASLDATGMRIDATLPGRVSSRYGRCPRKDANPACGCRSSTAPNGSACWPSTSLTPSTCTTPACGPSAAGSRYCSATS
jgi:hypothetical protein